MVEILNQFKQVWDVNGKEQFDLFRTKETLKDFKERIELEGYIVDGEWEDQGQVVVAYGILADSMNDIGRIQEFNQKKHNSDFGQKGYHTLDEILKSDLAWIRGYGIVEDKNDFENRFKDEAQKKSLSH